MISIEFPPDSKVHRANVGPIWGRQDPGGPHVGHMNFTIWADIAVWLILNQQKFIYSNTTDR